jgi:hypothetical protein
MGKYLRNKLVSLALIFAVSSIGAESTADDSIHNLPAPTKKSNWKASAFAGCALIAVVGGIFAICWSGGGKTPKNCNSQNQCSNPSANHCPNAITADCMAGSCIYQNNHPNQECGGCTDGGWNGQQQVINGPPPCCSVNGGVPPF